MQPGIVLSTAVKKNRSGIEVTTLVVEVRKDQNISAEWLNASGEATTPAVGDWVILAPRIQSFGGWLAFGFIDVINQIFAARGVKLIFGRDAKGVIKTKISLTESEVIIENPGGAQISLSGNNIIFNEGIGIAVEKERLQADLDRFSEVIKAEFVKVQAGTEPNPAAPYIPSAALPVDIDSSGSETIKIP